MCIRWIPCVSLLLLLLLSLIENLSSDHPMKSVLQKHIYIYIFLDFVAYTVTSGFMQKSYFVIIICFQPQIHTDLEC